MIELTEHGGGTVLRVRVQPGSVRERILGEYDGALKVSVSAPPERGKANQALRRLLAAGLGVTRRQVEIVAGEHSRDKTVRILGVIEPELRRRLQRLLGGRPS